MYHRRGNGRGDGGGGELAPSLSAKIILKIFPFFLNTILIRKTIRQDEESTNLRKNPY